MYRELNLLPPKRRRMLDNLLMLSIVARFIGFCNYGLLFLTAFGVAAIMILQGMIHTTSSALEADLQASVQEYRDIREEIAIKNNMVESMYSLSRERVVWSNYFDDFFAVLPPGVTIDRLNGFTVDGTRLEFSGVATTRSSLVVLEGRLSELEWVNDIVAPSSNLIRRDNPEYSFELLMDSHENSE